MSHQYYYGGEKAEIQAEDVDASWGSSPKAVALLNKSFEIYYDAYNAIRKFDDKPNLQGNMYRSLKKAASYWYPLYSMVGKVNTLVGAFDYLDKHDRWSDDNVGSYNGGVGGQGYVQPVPSCAASFLRAVDDNIENLKDSLGEVAEGMRQAKEGQDEDNTAWGKVGKGLEKIGKYQKYAKPLLWLAPDSLKEFGNAVIEWDEKVEKIYGYEDKLMRLAASNQPLDDLFMTGLTTLLGYLPILGGFYGRIIQEIPGMARHWEEFCNDYWARYGMQTYRASQGMAPMFR